MDRTPSGLRRPSHQPAPRSTRPIHPADVPDQPADRLIIDGLVEHRLELTMADLKELHQEALLIELTVLESCQVPGLNWKTVPLGALMDRAEIHPSVRWAQATGGTFSVPITLDLARTAIVAVALGDRALAVEYGGPIRLYIPGAAAYTSIKWLHRIELRERPAERAADAFAKRTRARREFHEQGERLGPGIKPPGQE